MIHFSYEESIEATPDAVFSVIADISWFDEWLSMDGRPREDSPVHVGSQFNSTGKMGPLTVHSSGAITRFEPDRAFGFAMRNPGVFDFVLELDLQPTNEGTRLTGSGSMTTHGLWRLLEPVLRSEVPKGEAAEARRLKAVVESGR